MPKTRITSPDSIALLKADHRAASALFKRFEASKSSSAKGKIAQQVCTALIIHTMIEEEIFYPGVKDAIDDDLYQEAYVEHDGAKVMIAEILAQSPEADFYDAKVKVLSEMIKHHVKEEEQPGGLFAQARKGDVDLKALGAALKARKAELSAQFKRSGPPAPQTKVMKGGRLERGTQPQA
ncbi:MAG TPA: hemerythrin domain-containing protein [Usitatibacter sp.]